MSRRRLFGSLCGLVFLVNLARIVFAPLLNVFITEFGITEGTAGLIATLAWIGSASLRLPAGWLLTRVPRHWVVLVSGEGVIESVTHEDAGCWNCVYERQHPARGDFYRRVLQCNGDRDARVVRAS